MCDLHDDWRSYWNPGAVYLQRRELLMASLNSLAVYRIFWLLLAVVVVLDKQNKSDERFWLQLTVGQLGKHELQEGVSNSDTHRSWVLFVDYVDFKISGMEPLEPRSQNVLKLELVFPCVKTQFIVVSGNSRARSVCTLSRANALVSLWLPDGLPIRYSRPHPK